MSDLMIMRTANALTVQHACPTNLEIIGQGGDCFAVKCHTCNRATFAGWLHPKPPPTIGWPPMTPQDATERLPSGATKTNSRTAGATMKTIPQQIYMIGVLMREAERKAKGRQSLIVPYLAVTMRRLGLRFDLV